VSSLSRRTDEVLENKDFRTESLYEIDSKPLESASLDQDVLRYRVRHLIVATVNLERNDLVASRYFGLENRRGAKSRGRASSGLIVAMRGIMRRAREIIRIRNEWTRDGGRGRGKQVEEQRRKGGLRNCRKARLGRK